MSYKISVTNLGLLSIVSTWEDNSLEKLSIFTTDNKSPKEGDVYLGVISDFLANKSVAVVKLSKKLEGVLPLRTKHKYHLGEKIIVQIKKETRSGKRVELTKNLKIIMPSLIWDSRVYENISLEIEKISLEQLKKHFEKGVVKRSFASLVGNREILLEKELLFDLVKKIKINYGNIKLGLLYSAPDKYISSIVDTAYLLPKIIVNDLDTYNKIKNFFSDTSLELNKKIDLVSLNYGQDDILYKLDKEINKLIDRNIDSSNGLNVVIDATSAGFCIDVNTGKAQNVTSIFDINLNAALLIAEHILLRGISGNIFIDFIGSISPENEKSILSAIKEKLKFSHEKYRFKLINQQGILLIFRQYQANSLNNIFFTGCSGCGVTGNKLSVWYKYYSLMVELIQAGASKKSDIVCVYVGTKLFSLLENHQSYSYDFLFNIKIIKDENLDKDSYYINYGSYEKV